MELEKEENEIMEKSREKNHKYKYQEYSTDNINVSKHDQLEEKRCNKLKENPSYKFFDSTQKLNKSNDAETRKMAKTKAYSIAIKSPVNSKEKQDTNDRQTKVVSSTKIFNIPNLSKLKFSKSKSKEKDKLEQKNSINHYIKSDIIKKKNSNLSKLIQINDSIDNFAKLNDKNHIQLNKYNNTCNQFSSKFAKNNYSIISDIENTSSNSPNLYVFNSNKKDKREKDASSNSSKKVNKEILNNVKIIQKNKTEESKSNCNIKNNVEALTENKIIEEGDKISNIKDTVNEYNDTIKKCKSKVLRDYDLKAVSTYCILNLTLIITYFITYYIY